MTPAHEPSGYPRGYYGVGVWKAKHNVNIGSLWRTAATYDAAFLALVGARFERQASDTGAAFLSTPLHRYPTMDDLIAHLPFGCRVVGVELDAAAVPLDEFTHPTQALYLLGAEDHGLSPSVLGQCHDVVTIPTPRPRSINVACAGSAVILDRYLAHRAQLRRSSVSGRRGSRVPAPAAGPGR